MSIKLNIGAGNVDLEGFAPIDRKLGLEAYPLDYPDGSVEEIRASHVLEHFSFADAMEALKDWTRVLQPGGVIKIAVPDIDKCLDPEQKNRVFYLMGGQTDADDFHRSAYDRPRLEAYMRKVGLVDIDVWESDGKDTSAHPVSLNLQGRKPTVEAVADTGPEMQDIKIGAFMTLPRYEAVAARSIIELSLKKLGIGLATSQGVFWGQCMQRMFETAVADGLDWILSVDSDSLFTADHVSSLLDAFAQCPDADAMAALQCRRGKGFPLLTIGGQQGITIDNLAPFKVTTAHFGLTLIRVDALRNLPKPWFKSEPDENGEYSDDRLDDDIWFWHQWRLAGKTIYVAPAVSIGHLEETVAVFDEKLQPKHEYIHEWRSTHLPRSVS